MRVLHLRRVILPSRNKAMIRVNQRGVKRADAAIVVISSGPSSTRATTPGLRNKATMRVLHLRRVILPSRNKAMIRVNLRGVKRADAAIVLVIARRPSSTALICVLHKY